LFHIDKIDPVFSNIKYSSKVVKLKKIQPELCFSAPTQWKKPNIYFAAIMFPWVWESQSWNFCIMCSLIHLTTRQWTCFDTIFGETRHWMEIYA